MSITNTSTMRITIPRVTQRLRGCTEMWMRWSPLGLKLRSPPIGFRVCWNTWALPPPLDIGSRKSRVQGGWNSRPSLRSSSGTESSVDTRGQLLEHLIAILWLTPPGRPSLLGSVATRADCRTPSTASYLIRRRTSSGPMG
jgi:hypothetical protein